MLDQEPDTHGDRPGIPQTFEPVRTAPGCAISPPFMDTLARAQADNGDLNFKAAAEYLGRKVQTLYNWISSGRGPRRFKRFGRWYFRRTDLDAYVRHCTETHEAFR